MRPGTVAVAYLHHNEITGAFLASLYKLIGQDDAIIYPPIQNQSNSDIATGRNQCVSAFLNQTDAEWLWFIDDDMGFPPDIVQKLLAAANPRERPVVGGLCFAYKRYEIGPEHAERFRVGPTIYKLVETATQFGYSQVSEYEPDSLVEVDATGAACLLIHRSILDGMQQVSGQTWFSHVTIPKGPSGQTTLSEDLSFCFKLHMAGIPIHVHTGAKTSHRKPIHLDEWYFENQPVRMDPPQVAIVGTGRSGTGFIASALSSCHLPTGHEQWWNPFGVQAPGLVGDASWIATNYLDEYEGRVWHQVRHPLLVIRSLLAGELFDGDAPDWVEPFETERRRWAGYNPDDPPEIKAMRVVAHWWQTAEKHAQRTYRIEDMTPGLLVELCDELGADVPLRYARIVIDRHGTETNAHNPDKAEGVRWADLPDCDDKRLIADMAAGFGYETLEV